MTRTRPFGRLEDGTAVQAFRLGSLRAATEAYLTRYASYLLA